MPFKVSVCPKLSSGHSGLIDGQCICNEKVVGSISGR